MLLAAGSPSAALDDADAVTLPRPTGGAGVGTVVAHLVDAERPDPKRRDGGPREIMVQAWYPAAEGDEAGPAAYAPLYPFLRRVEGWSRPDVPAAHDAGRLYPVILCPGRGVARHYYTSIAEDLASHGHLVVGIDSPHTGRVRYPDGREVMPDPDYRPSFELITGPYEKVDEFFEEPATAGAADVAMTLAWLAALEPGMPGGRLAGRIDLERLGALGHSLGGRICGQAVGADPRFVAYATMEGVPPRDVRYGGMDAAVMQLITSGLPDMAMPNIESLIPPRRNDVYVVTLLDFGHNSITDLPLVWPGDYDYGVGPVSALARIRSLLTTFFDHHLLAMREGSAGYEVSDHVAIEHYPAPAE